jgi:hypothetical protein
MKKNLLIFSFLLCLFCLTGCRSTAYYRAKAAEDARRFLLENAPELTSEQAAFVKYNDPVLLTAPVLGSEEYEPGEGAKEKRTSYLHQICVTWNIPGCRNLYMVFGVSDARMFSWQPLRLIRKDFGQLLKPEDAAVAASRRYAVDNLYHALSVKDFNRIRFEFPFIARTAFKLNFNLTGKMTAEEIRKAEKAAEKKKQYSLYWINSDGSATVFCGLAEVDMKGWKLNFAGVVKKEELSGCLLGVVRTPEQYEKNITPLEKDVKSAEKEVKKDK